MDKVFLGISDIWNIQKKGLDNNYPTRSAFRQSTTLFLKSCSSAELFSAYVAKQI